MSMNTGTKEIVHSGIRTNHGDSMGFTLIELVIAIAIASILATVSVQAYTGYVEDTRVKKAIGDIKLIEVILERHRTDAGRYPDNIAIFGDMIPTDPWGNAYVYLNIENGGKNIKGKVRKDKNLTPLNSDYDLYSAGKDGASKLPLPPKVSHDDVIRASNGAYTGLGVDY